MDKSEKTKGVDLICVVDVSGSMSGSRINLVKESLKYLTKLMDNRDRLAIVAFTDSASVKLHLTDMTEANKETAIKDKTDPFNMNGDNVITPSGEESATETSTAPVAPTPVETPAAPVAPAPEMPAPVAAPSEPTEQLIDTLPNETVNQIERAVPEVGDVSNNIVANNQQNVIEQIQNTQVPPQEVVPTPVAAPVQPQVTTSFNSRPVVSGYMQTPPADAVIN